MKNLNKESLKKIVRYIFSAGTSFIIDLLLFTIFNLLFSNIINSLSIILATILARILSSLYNYLMNSRYVFKKYNKTSLIKYYALVIIQMGVSAISVYLLSFILPNINDTFIKFFVDIIIFIINYIVQKELIFK